MDQPSYPKYGVIEHSIVQSPRTTTRPDYLKQNPNCDHSLRTFAYEAHTYTARIAKNDFAVSADV